MPLTNTVKAIGLLAFSFCAALPAYASNTTSPITLALSELGVTLDELPKFAAKTPKTFKSNDSSIRQTQIEVNGVVVTLTGKSFNSSSQISKVTFNLGKDREKATNLENLFNATFAPSQSARNRKLWKFPTTEPLGWSPQQTRVSLSENSDQEFIFTIDRRGVGPGNTSIRSHKTKNSSVKRTSQSRQRIKKRNDF